VFVCLIEGRTDGVKIKGMSSEKLNKVKILFTVK
jgi:hypothetical protein